MTLLARYREAIGTRVTTFFTCAFGSCTCIGLAIAMVSNGASDVSSGVLCTNLVILGTWFGYLSKRSWRLGIDLTDTTIRIRQLFWDRAIPLNRIASLQVEEWHDLESGSSRWHVARDPSQRKLFEIMCGVPKLDEFIDSMRRLVACRGIPKRPPQER
jgi:hypothetical protein